MKSLIVFYSGSGNNTALAYHIEKKLACDIEEIVPERKRTNFSILLDIAFNRLPAVKPLQANLREYEMVILVAPVWNARMASPMRTFVKEYGAGIEACAFISLCGGRDGQRQKIVDQLMELLHDEPIAVEELALRDLFKDGRHADVKNVSNYRVTENDFSFFDDAIDNFLRRVGVFPMTTDRKEAYNSRAMDQ